MLRPKAKPNSCAEKQLYKETGSESFQVFKLFVVAVAIKMYFVLFYFICKAASSR